MYGREGLEGFAKFCKNNGGEVVEDYGEGQIYHSGHGSIAYQTLRCHLGNVDLTVSEEQQHGGLGDFSLKMESKDASLFVNLSHFADKAVHWPPVASDYDTFRFYKDGDDVAFIHCWGENEWRAGKPAGCVISHRGNTKIQY